MDENLENKTDFKKKINSFFNKNNKIKLIYFFYYLL